jgi:hypothetical protein
MAVAFAISTIAPYELLCVYSTAGLERVRLGAFERYSEVRAARSSHSSVWRSGRDRSLPARHAGFWQQLGNTPSAYKCCQFVATFWFIRVRFVRLY